MEAKIKKKKIIILSSHQFYQLYIGCKSSGKDGITYPSFYVTAEQQWIIFIDLHCGTEMNHQFHYFVC